LLLLYCYFILNSYRVNTSTNSSEFNSSECSCTRRYSDFEWLHDQLSFFFASSITPPLPEKQTVGRFTPEFIESRRRGIEKFMNRVTKHPILKDAAVLATFLQSDDSGFAQCKAKYKQDRAAATGSVSGWFGDKLNTLSTHTVIEPTEDDANVQSALDYVLAWERQLTTVAKQSSQIVKSARDKSKSLFEFGQAFSSLGLNETNQELGDVLSNVSSLLHTSPSLPLLVLCCVALCCVVFCCTELNCTVLCGLCCHILFVCDVSCRDVSCVLSC
jgi:sorting nexin-1/2